MMNTEELPQHDPTESAVREAYADLAHRSTMVSTANNPSRVRSSDRRFLFPSVMAVLLTLGGLAFWQLNSGSVDEIEATTTDSASTGFDTDSSPASGTSDDQSTPGVAVTSDGEPGGTDSAASAQNSTVDTSGVTTPARGQRLAVNASRVSDDVEDPFLNVRTGPGATRSLLAALPPAYRGLRATGTTELVGGGTWIEVELLYPLPLKQSWSQSEGEYPTGWVLSTLVVDLPGQIAVGTSEIPPCSQGEGEVIGTNGKFGSFHGLETMMVSNNCLRVIVTTPSSTADDQLWWPRILQTADDAYVTYGTGAFGLEMTRPFDNVYVANLADQGLSVIDFSLTGEAAPPADSQVALIAQPEIQGNTVRIAGIGRPFEARLGIELVDADSGEVVKQTSTTTTSWSDAYGYFSFDLTDLTPGRYQLFLDGGDGSDPRGGLEITFTITDDGGDNGNGDGDPVDPAQALVAFAQGEATDLPLADSVTLALGPTSYTTRSASELANPANWVLDVEEFEGFAGPFDLLEPLNGQGPVTYSTGPTDHCAGPPRTWPSWGQGTQYNIEADGIDSCISWFAVSLFVDDNGLITAVTLDLYGP